MLLPLLTFYVARLLYVPPGLTFKNLHADYIAFICFVWLSEETVTFALYIINILLYTSLTYCFFVAEVESVYCEVRPESLHKTDTFRP